jgi:hypothetical protein
MTAEKHNKLIGIFFFCHTIFIVLLFVVLIEFVRTMAGLFVEVLVSILSLGTKHADGPPSFWEILTMLDWKFWTFFVLNVLIHLLAGFSLLLKKSWGRIAGIVGAINAIISTPLGIIFGVYALIFFFSKKGQQLYARSELHLRA